MVRLLDQGVYVLHGDEAVPDGPQAAAALRQAGMETTVQNARRGTMAHAILTAHDQGGAGQQLRIRFDALASHDITYVGIIQTARASGLTAFPVPYVLTNCHNTLCAVGGTINEDDHLFALSAAKKYGGIYVPPHLAVIHQYMRERMAVCGGMILGSDSHTRYGALGTLAIGEGGGELAKQLLGRTYDLAPPDVVAVRLSGSLRPGAGPQDVALAIIGAVFASGFVKNKVMEFIGPGIAGLSVDARNGIDVMTTETACLSSIWATDDAVRAYYALHGRPEAYRPMAPAPVAYYDGLIEVDLDAITPMIALPFHPSNVYTIADLNANAEDILAGVEADARRALVGTDVALNLRGKLRDGRLMVDQAVVAGCAGGSYENIAAVADILRERGVGNGALSMSVYPASQPVYLQLVESGGAAALMQAGVVVRSAFCGPCFGAGDTPANGALSIRHTTRNFPNREGSKPGEGQLACVALMDARSIAATVANGGALTAATDMPVERTSPVYAFHGGVYARRVYDGTGKPDPGTQLRFGPNIADWPRMPALTDDLLLRVDSFITDPVTTTDELIPSGEASSFRSNPHRLAEFTLSRRDPGYVNRAKATRAWEQARQAAQNPAAQEPLAGVYKKLAEAGAALDPARVGVGSMVYAYRPGDGSAREQAAACQRVLGGWANVAREYATRRYRANLINWGILPFILADEAPFAAGDYVLARGLLAALAQGRQSVRAYAIGKTVVPFTLALPGLTGEEGKILAAGCLINYYKS
ncbi:MAG: hydratase [Oscillospiraceae bacterium]|jgi:aconitate hydratase|nr:hydratase [Oscillospiraceae bacterium]